VLVVEDEPLLAEAIRDGLRLEAIAADIAGDGDTALEMLAVNSYDLAVLDRDIPGPSGDEIARRIVGAGTGMPIIMLTAADRLDDKASGFELGADDYLTKPFSPRELLARIRTVLRRTHAGQEVHGAPVCRAYRIPGWELNLRTRRLTGEDGAEVALSNGEFNLLAALLATANRVVTRDQLIEMSRRYDNEVYDRAVDVQILRLRRKLERNPAEPQIIVTERGAGYRIAVPVEAVY